MQILFKIFLVFHILGGAIGLFTGTLNIILKKGDKKHKKIGTIFLYAMLVTGFSSLVLAIIHPNYFLFIVGIFTLYLTSTGKRYLFFKSKSRQNPQKIDWILTFTMLIVVLVFISFGAYMLYRSNNFGIVFLVFGALGIRLAITDLNNYKGKSTLTNYWLIGHIGRMTGSYIAALTAFLVVNESHMPKFIPSYVIWIFPTIILLPVIIIWIKKYKVVR